MISTEEKLEAMERERKSYREGYKDALCMVLVVIVTATILRIIWWG